MTGEFGFRNGVGIPSGGPGVVGELPSQPTVPADAPIHYRENLALAFASVNPWSIRALQEDGAIDPGSLRRQGLPLTGRELPAAIKQGNPGYATAAIGKWHLAGLNNGWLDHPKNAGFDFYSIIHNNALNNYFAWVETTNGVPAPVTGYTPEAKVDTALEWIEAQDQPWFLWFAFNLPHLPYYAPPQSELDPQSPDAGITADQLPNPIDYSVALIEEMDRLVAVLMAGIDAEVLQNTVIIFVGDNGSTREGVGLPYTGDKAKFTLYQGGIHVPLLVAGAGVTPGGNSDALVNTTDLYATILDLANASEGGLSTPDSISLLPYLSDPAQASLRDTAYADRLYASAGIEAGDFAIRDARYKLISSTVRQAFYDLREDPGETRDLLTGELEPEQRSAMTALQDAAAALHASAGARSPSP